MNIIIAIVILTAYIVTVCIVNKQIPSSLSASVFFLPKQGVWIWSVVIAAVVFLMVPTYIEKTSDTVKFLAFLACAGLLFVGGAPLVRDRGNMAYKVHLGGAVLCAVSSQVLLAIDNGWLLLSWVPWICAFVWITREDRWRTGVFWAEMTCFADTFIFCSI